MDSIDDDVTWTRILYKYIVIPRGFDTARNGWIDLPTRFPKKLTNDGTSVRIWERYRIIRLIVGFTDKADCETNKYPDFSQKTIISYTFSNKLCMSYYYRHLSSYIRLFSIFRGQENVKIKKKHSFHRRLYVLTSHITLLLKTTRYNTTISKNYREWCISFIMHQTLMIIVIMTLIHCPRWLCYDDCNIFYDDLAVKTVGFISHVDKK